MGSLGKKLLSFGTKVRNIFVSLLEKRTRVFNPFSKGIIFGIESLNFIKRSMITVGNDGKTLKKQKIDVDFRNFHYELIRSTVFKL